MDILQTLRLRAGFTQVRLAAAVEVDPSYLSQLEAGVRRPSVAVLDRLLRELGATDAERSEALAQAAAEPAPAVAA